MTLSCDFDDWANGFQRTIWRKARKPHRCCECRKEIKAGDEYQYISGVWDGIPDSYHTCERCADLRDSMIELGYCMIYGDLLEDHAEYVRQLKEEAE